MEQNLPSQAATSSSRPQRLVFLDVLRGLTVGLMILVNNNGSEAAAYSQMKHSEWNGWTLTDLVFPTFLFLVGITIVLSISSRIQRGESSATLVSHAFRRAALLFVLGIVIHGFPHYDLRIIRIYGVLQRIAICYLVCMLLFLWNRRPAFIVAITSFCLAGYWVLMRWVPVPGFGIPGRDFPFMDQEINWVSVVDRGLFPGRLLEGTHDPLGLVSTIPALGTCMLGILCGQWLRANRSPKIKLLYLVLSGTAVILCGLLWSSCFPINKQLWTSSYVLFAGGCTLMLLSGLYFLIDMRKHSGAWTFPWRVLGSNAIFVYAFSELLSSCMGIFPLWHHRGLRGSIFDGYLIHVVSPAFGSLLYSLGFLLACFLPCLILYRRKIFLKL